MNQGGERSAAESLDGRRHRPLRVLDVGDGAFLAEFAPAVDRAINAAAIALANAIRSAAIAGVRDVVPTFRSVAVYVDPLVVDREEVRQRLRDATPVADQPLVPRIHHVPVVYGGEAGEDLEAVAAASGMAPADVASLHASGEYRVFMLGFLPGFGYLGPVSPRLVARRRASPRVRVPAGAVGVAGMHTGIYPRASPGGWALIGRSPVPLFDVRRPSPALLAAGDTVRFTPVASAEWGEVEGASPGQSGSIERGQPFVEVRSAGVMTTTQDLGRHGHQHLGVSVAGAMDEVSLRIANVAVGNHRAAAALEATITGPELVCHGGATVAIAGCDLSPHVDGRPVPRNQPLVLAPGAVLSFGARRDGARAYVAFAGGLDVPACLGSRATHLASRIGGHGRPLTRGDRLGLRRPPTVTPPVRKLAGAVAAQQGVTLRVLPGPQYDRFPRASAAALTRARFVLSNNSNRMGYRLEGPMLQAPDGEMISDAAFLGALQVPPSGQPILLMADRQTTGGYPQLAIVISADLPLAGQLAPGDSVAFEWTTLEIALAALTARERTLRALEDDARH